MKEVYCRNCIHRKDGSKWIPQMLRSVHIYCCDIDSYKNYNGNIRYKTECEDKNKNKNCKDYKRLWWKFLV